MSWLHQYKGLIMEGPDCVGKTTLITSKITHYGIKHCTKPDDNAEWPEWMFDHLQPYTLHDRFQLGGYVYGLRLGLHPCGGMTEQDFLDYTEELRRQGYPTVIFYVPEEYEEWYRTHLATEQARNRQEMFSTDQIIEANRIYRELAMREDLLCARMRVDLSNWPNWQRLQYVVSDLRTRAEGKPILDARERES